MKSWVILLLGVCVIFGVIFIQCGAGGVSFKEPEGDNLLIIGSVVVENNEYLDRTESLTDKITVAVVGYNTVDGKQDIRGYWTETDKDGYFALYNMPKGRYALQGIQAYIAGSALATIQSNLEGPGAGYYWLRGSALTITFKAAYFPPEPKGRVYNLNHHAFAVYNDRAVKHFEYYSMDNQKVTLNDFVYNRPNCLLYFKEKLAGTGWEPFLIAQ